jgi:hypothetical protein
MTDDKEKVDKENIEGLSALYSGVAQNLSMVHSADDAVEFKIASYLAGSLVILTLVLNRTHTWRVLSFLGVGLLAIGIIVALISLWSRAYNSVAVKVSENLDYLDLYNRELLMHLISDAEDSIEESNEILIKKARLHAWVLMLFASGSFISLLSFYIKIVGV